MLLALAAPSHALTLKGRIQVPEGYPELKNAVISIHGFKTSRAKSLNPQKITIDQKNFKYIPYISVAEVGAEVVFKNSDTSLHTVVTQDGPLGRKNFALQNLKSLQRITVKKPGVSEILCSVHAQMKAYLVVLDTPYHAISDEKGEFTIKDLPNASFEIHVWHEVFPPLQLKIQSNEEIKKPLTLVLKSWDS